MNKIGNLKITITGPESSGKTTLARALSEDFAIMLVPEYARIYFSQKQTSVYRYSDLLEIGKGQFNLEMDAVENLMRHSSLDRPIVTDTDLLTIIIWSLDKFGKVDSEITRLWCSSIADLYLVCKPDIMWQPDPLREDPHRRNSIYDYYLNFMNALGLNYKIIEGEKRINKAIKIVNDYLEF